MAGEARWHGDDYQSRFFWVQAASLLDPQATHVVEVAFEADGPKAFDDVVVRYNPGRRSTGKFRVSVDHYQIKWHVDRSGRFGYEDLVDPGFINAKTQSILERLRDAKGVAPEDSAFHLVTTDGVSDGNPLSALLSAKDGQLLVERLFSTKTDNSKMGRVRKLWREHLGLENDEQLRLILEGFHVHDYHDNLESLRDRAADRLRIVGLVAGDDTSDFRYDSLARTLAFRKINNLSRETFRTLVDEEGCWFPHQPQTRTNIALRSFARGIQPLEKIETNEDNSLDLTERFDGRHLLDAETWHDVRKEVTDFLTSALANNDHLRLYFDAHASIMFLAGALLGFKSGADVELRQRQRSAPTRNWHASDGLKGPPPKVRVHTLGDGNDIALAIGLTRAETFTDARQYVGESLPSVGTIIDIEPADGSGQNAVAGGEHAAAIADLIASEVAKARKPGARIHIFASAPNAFLFLLGQHAEVMGRCLPYEFDFGGRIDGTYRPTFEI